jgi:hypothetical protein
MDGARGAGLILPAAAKHDVRRVIAHEPPSEQTTEQMSAPPPRAISQPARPALPEAA